MKFALLFRHNYERTWLHFLHNTVDLLEPDAIYSITDVPFAATFKHMLQICQLTQFDYYLAIDADVWLFDGDKIKQAMASGLGYAGFNMVDKFRGSRRAGLHLYCREAIRHIIERDNIPSLRPEGSNVVALLRTKAFKTNESEWLGGAPVGYHDFLQYRKDLFYKYCIRYYREINGNQDIQMKEWSGIDDDDFKVVVEAYRWAKQTGFAGFSAMPRELIDKVFAKVGITEKSKIVDIKAEVGRIVDGSDRCCNPKAQY